MTIKPPNEDIIVRLYTQLNNDEQSINSSQLKCRMFAPSWLFAAFTAIGFILSSQEVGLPFHRSIAVLMVSILGFLGIYGIWRLDLFLFHALLTAVAHEEISMEAKVSWLPNTRRKMAALVGGSDHYSFCGIKFSRHKDAAKSASWYYFVCLALIHCALDGALFWLLWKGVSLGTAFVVTALMLGTLPLLYLHMTRAPTPFAKSIKILDDVDKGLS